MGGGQGPCKVPTSVTWQEVGSSLNSAHPFPRVSGDYILEQRGVRGVVYLYWRYKGTPAGCPAAHPGLPFRRAWGCGLTAEGWDPGDPDLCCTLSCPPHRVPRQGRNTHPEEHAAEGDIALEPRIPQCPGQLHSKLLPLGLGTWSLECSKGGAAPGADVPALPPWPLRTRGLLFCPPSRISSAAWRTERRERPVPPPKP